jgi:hypothetical protein
VRKRTTTPQENALNPNSPATMVSASRRVSNVTEPLIAQMAPMRTENSAALLPRNSESRPREWSLDTKLSRSDLALKEKVRRHAGLMK